MGGVWGPRQTIVELRSPTHVHSCPLRKWRLLGHLRCCLHIVCWSHLADAWRRTAQFARRPGSMQFARCLLRSHGAQPPTLPCLLSLSCDPLTGARGLLRSPPPFSRRGTTFK